MLFDLFDVDRNGVVDFQELLSGLSILCGGTRDDKVLAAFELFDLNGDGFISQPEMEQYLTSVFRVVFQTSEGLFLPFFLFFYYSHFCTDVRAQAAVSPEELAIVTTTQCFEDCDLNHDGKLSFDEFKR